MSEPTSNSNWQAGDLALCILGGPIISSTKPKEFPVCGRLYTVAAVSNHTFDDGTGKTTSKTGLRLKDGPPNCDGSHTWISHRFVKIPPHKMDIDDEEVLSQMLNKPAPKIKVPQKETV